MALTAATKETPRSFAKRRSTLNFLSVLILCTTSSCLTAAIVMIYQYKLGIPFSMAVSLMIAVAFAVLIPLLITIVFKAFNKKLFYGPYLAFLLSNLVISVTLGLLIF